jgi:hypothetical protein
MSKLIVVADVEDLRTYQCIIKKAADRVHRTRFLGIFVFVRRFSVVGNGIMIRVRCCKMRGSMMGSTSKYSIDSIRHILIIVEDSH